MEVTEIQAKLKDTLPWDTFSDVQRLQAEANGKLQQKVKAKQQKKLQNLKSETKLNTTHADAPTKIPKTVVNLSSKSLTEDQQCILGKGFKYVLTQLHKNHDDFIASVELGLQKLAPGGKVDYLYPCYCMCYVSNCWEEN